jgi:hypothetical protein
MGATRGQHYLPKFLLKGFASRTREDKAWVYYFRRNAAVKEVSVADIGKQTDFHGNPRDSDLENRMQAVESLFGPHLAKWRAGEFISEADGDLAAQFVAHILIRTKSLRDAVEGGAQFLMTELTGRLDRGEFNPFSRTEYEAEIIEKMRANPSLAKFARKKPREFKALVRVKLAEAKQSGKVLEWNQQVAEQARAVDVSRLVAQAHINSLTRSQIPDLRVKVLQALSWSLSKTNQPVIILGDAGAMARDTDDPQFKNPFTLDFERIGMVCCPISSNAVLVGRAPGVDHTFAADEINLASAELSRDFFVASQRDQDFEDLQKVIRHRADLVSEEELRTIISEATPYSSGT